jgi:hypothetical protein
VGLRQLALCGVRHAAAVVDGGGGTAIQFGIFGQRLCDQVIPPAEPDEHVDPQGHERLQPVGHWWRLDCQQFGRELTGELGRGIQGGARTTLEHRGVHDEVQVVRPVERVEVQRALTLDKAPIHLYCR